MKWLITGGSGLIGRNIIRQMNTSGNAKQSHSTVILDVKDKPPQLDDRWCHWVIGDITNKEQLETIIDEHQVQGIVHLVSLLRGECAKQPYLAAKINVGGFNNILDIAVSRKIQKVIFASSVQVYGAESYYGTAKWIDETTERKPQTLYGITKCHCEDLAAYYNENLGANVVGLRFSTVYGYGRSTGPNVYLTDAIAQAARHQDITIPYKDLCQNLLYVKDAAGAIVHCMNADKYKKTVYNICSEKIISNVDVAEALRELAPDIKIELTGGEFPIQGATPYTSPKAASEELGFTLKYPLGTAIRDFIQEAVSS